MARNVSNGLYAALRRRARENRTSIAAEVGSLLAEILPTAPELKRRKYLLQQLARIRSSAGPQSVGSEHAEQMLREDRER